MAISNKNPQEEKLNRLKKLVEEISKMRLNPNTKEGPTITQVHISKVEFREPTKSGGFFWLFLIGLVTAIAITLLVLYITSSNLKTGNIPTKSKNDVFVISWTEFKNDNLGFKLKYPSDWKQPQINTIFSGQEVNFDKNLKITISNYINQPNTKDPIDDEINNVFKGKNYKVEDYIAGNLKGKIAVANSGLETTETLIVLIKDVSKNQLLIIDYFITINDVNKYYIFDYILSTFEIIKQAT